MENNQKTTILIVEDDVSIAELVKDLLNDELNYHAVVVGNGSLAIEFLKSIKINLLILDIGLPGISGLGIYDWLLNNHKLDHTPVIFMTAQSNQYQRELEKRNVRYVIRKPFDLDEFLDITRQALTEGAAEPPEADHSQLKSDADTALLENVGNYFNISGLPSQKHLKTR